MSGAVKLRQVTDEAARRRARGRDGEPPASVEGGRVSAPSIAIIRQKYRPDGGGERFVSGLLSVLRRRAYDVTLITRRWEGGANPSVLTCNPPKAGRMLRDWGFARAVCRRLKQYHFDLVQSNERIACCDVYRAGDGVHREWLSQRRRIQSLPARLFVALSPYHAYVKHAEKRLFESNRLRAVICNSRMVREEILNHFDIDGCKLRVIYTGVDTETFHPKLKAHRRAVRGELGIPDDAPAFIFVGSGFERKGLMRAISCLAQLPEAHLVVVGKDKRPGTYRRRAARLGLARRVHLLGVRQEVGPYYGAADALVLPTLYDPFPNVVLEAMACGLPVITSTKCGAAELIRKGRGGYVCDALDDRALTDAMRRLTDGGHCRQLGGEARRIVEPYTLDAMRDNLTQLYRELLHEPG